MSLDINWSLLSSTGSHAPTGASAGSGPNHDLASHLVASLNKTLSTTTRPSFIGPISITQFDFGDAGPEVEIRDIRDVWREFDDGESDGDDGDEDEGEGELGSGGEGAEGFNEEMMYSDEGDEYEGDYRYGNGNGHGNENGYDYGSPADSRTGYRGNHHQHQRFPSQNGYAYETESGYQYPRNFDLNGDGEGGGDMYHDNDHDNDDTASVFSSNADGAISYRRTPSVAAVGIGTGMLSPSLSMSFGMRGGIGGGGGGAMSPGGSLFSHPLSARPFTASNADRRAGQGRFGYGRPAERINIRGGYHPPHTAPLRRRDSRLLAEDQHRHRIRQQQQRPRRAQRQAQSNDHQTRSRSHAFPSPSPSPSSPPLPSSTSRSTPSNPIPSIQLHLRMTHTSNLSLTLLTSLIVNYPSSVFMSLPLKLVVTGLELDADVVLAYVGERKRAHLTIVDVDHGGDEGNGTGDGPHGLYPCFKPAPALGQEAKHQRHSNENGFSPNHSHGHSHDDHDNNINNATNRQGLPTDIGHKILPNLHIETEIGHADVHVLRNVGKVERFIADVVRKMVVDELVWPNYYTVAM